MAKMSDEDKAACSLMTPEFRVSHPHVFKASRMKNLKTGKEEGEPSYSIEMLFDKKTTKLSTLKKPLKYATALKHGEDETAWPEDYKWPVRDGDKPHGKKKEVKEEHKGMWVMKASTKEQYGKPYVVGKDPKVSLEEKDMYAGCYARAALFASVYEFGDKEGVKYVLDGVQKIRNGDSLSGKKPADQVFGMIEGGDEDEESFDSSDFDNSNDDEDEE